MFRYGSQVAAAELNSLYADSRAVGFGAEVIEIFIMLSKNERKILLMQSSNLRSQLQSPHCDVSFFNLQVKMRILMGTYALSAGYYDAYYKRAQQVFFSNI